MNALSTPDPVLNVEQIRSRRFGLLEEMARDIKSNVVFPVCFDVSTRITDALRSDDSSIEMIAEVVLGDPLLVSKVIQVANSTRFNPYRADVQSVRQALSRIGVRLAQALAISCAMAQIAKSAPLAGFQTYSRELLAHCLRTGAIARLLAQRFTPRINPETAMVAGLVHDIGAFYVLDRAARDEELRQRPETLRHLVAKWHEAIGDQLLIAMQQPEDIIEAVRDHDTPRDMSDVPRTLGDIVYLANLFAGGIEEMMRMDVPKESLPKDVTHERYAALRADIELAAAEAVIGW